MVVIEISSGQIRGKVSLDDQNQNFFSFQNVPYAEPPVGKLRFRAPRPVRPWKGVKECTQEGNPSVSRHLITRKLLGSEDCLNLNVYTPELPRKGAALKPVMFWIHGGIFMNGSNSTELFGPEYLMTEDIVLVTINYRLGILGFLSLEDPSVGVPGNAGFKDMVMALRWVQQNIFHFCGDPNNVTVFGESAGAAAAHLLMLSPMAKGLFHKIIAQSACALNTWVYGRRSGRIIGEKLGFYGTDDGKLLEFLETVPAVEILKAQIKIDADDFVESDLRFFGVVVERPSDEEAFMGRDPVDVIVSRDYNHVPLIMGYNHREGMAIDDTVPGRSRTPFFENMELSVPLLLKIERGSDLSKQIAERIRLFYFGNVKQNRKQHLRNYYDLSTDTMFLRDIYFSVKHHLKTSTKPIYFYKMALETELNIFKKLTGATTPAICGITGVYHGDDQGYIFKTIFTPEITPGSVEDIAQKRLTRLWTNFAKYSDPTPGPDKLIPVKWKEVKQQQFNYLEIGEDLIMKSDPEPERMAFWEKIYKLNPVVSKL